MKEAVVFRRYSDGEVLALFPDIDAGRGFCQSYMHIGQHGAADYTLCIGQTKPASPSEYRSLKGELEKRGYDPRVICRRSSKKLQRNVV